MTPTRHVVPMIFYNALARRTGDVNLKLMKAVALLRRLRRT